MFDVLSGHKDYGLPKKTEKRVSRWNNNKNNNNKNKNNNNSNNNNNNNVQIYYAAAAAAASTKSPKRFVWKVNRTKGELRGGSG